jgi:NAD(P)-dependent dehydrogenase (short-subunit alcohol dehydrogenase family)
MATGRVLITGSTDGIGKQTALELAGQGMEVIVHGRSEERVNATARDIRKASPDARVETISGNLASLDQVRRLAAEVKQRFDQLDVLINNAGVMTNTRQESEDGYELTFAVNHLAHFLLTNLLLDLMVQSAPGRIITVSSMVHASGEIRFDDLQMRRGYNGYRAYAQSKLANVLFAYELARRLEGTGVTSNALHPGVIGTKLLHVSFAGGGPVEEGAQTPVFLATSPEVASTTGQYYSNRRPERSSTLSYDEQLAKRLWDISEELTGLKSES